MRVCARLCVRMFECVWGRAERVFGFSTPHAQVPRVREPLQHGLDQQGLWVWKKAFELRGWLFVIPLDLNCHKAKGPIEAF